MKKIFILTVCVLVCLTGAAQYAPWEPSQGPLNFNTLDYQNNHYIKVNYTPYTGSYSSYTQNSGIGTSGSYTTHKLITTQGFDPCRCFTADGTNYIHEQLLPQSWSGEAGQTLDTIIMLGCNNCTSSCFCTGNSQIEYWFYPQPEESTLLVYFSFAEEDVSSHSADYNPRFYIEVLDGQTEQLIPSGYYKRANGTINTAWPYSRFLAVPSGSNSNQDSHTSPDALGITTYYWAYSEATPTTFPFHKCPPGQNGNTSQYNVGWFQFKPIAFDLSSYAEQGKSVKLRIRVRACQAMYHWACGYFAAKMIPGTIHADACGDQSTINLSVPWGLDERTYEWHFGYDSLDACNRIIDPTSPIPGVSIPSVYDIYIDRNAQEASGQPVWPYYRCEMKSYTGVPFVYEAHIKAYYLKPNFNFKQSFDNCDLRVTFSDSSQIYTKTPPNQAGGSWDSTFQNIRHIQWFAKNQQNQNFDSIPNHYGDTSFTYVFQHPYIDTLTGEAFIKIVIQDSAQKCIKDTIKRIQLDLSAIRDTLTKDTVYTCEEKLPYVFDRAYFGETHTWATEGTRRVTYDTLAWNGCDSLVDVTLIVRKPKVEIISDPEYCEAFTTNLTVECEDSNDSILLCNWNNGETAPFTTVTAPGTYTVEIMNKDSCTASGSIVIPACKPFLNLPNTFSPSEQDGVNDYFFIPQSNLIKELEFTVFNRHGVVVYHTTNKDFQWNGTENGKLYVGATYTYILRIVDYEGVSSWHKGAITIL